MIIVSTGNVTKYLNCANKHLNCVNKLIRLLALDLKEIVEPGKRWLVTFDTGKSQFVLFAGHKNLVELILKCVSHVLRCWVLAFLVGIWSLGGQSLPLVRGGPSKRQWRNKVFRPAVCFYVNEFLIVDMCPVGRKFCKIPFKFHSFRCLRL